MATRECMCIWACVYMCVWCVYTYMPYIAGLFIWDISKSFWEIKNDSTKVAVSKGKLTDQQEVTSVGREWGKKINQAEDSVGQEKRETHSMAGTQWRKNKEMLLGFPLDLFIFKNVCMDIYMCVLLQHICRSPRTICGSWFFSSITWVMEIEIRWSGLMASALTAGPPCWPHC